MRTTPLEIIMLIVVITLVILPSGPAAPVDPVDPTPVVEVDTRDVLEKANDTMRSELAKLLRVYAGEDLTDSKIFGQFSTEFGLVQAEAMMPVSKIIVGSTDLLVTASELDNKKLGVE